MNKFLEDDLWSREFDRESRSMFAGFGFAVIATVLLNLAFWGGLIYFGFWCAQHFGLI